MEIKIQPTNSTEVLTAEIAQEIYSEILAHGNADLAVKHQANSERDPENFEKVNKEADRIVKELNEFKSGKLLEAEEFHFDEESMEKVIDKEAVYYEYTTDADLIKQVSSELLDVATVLNDLM